jgi:NADH:ubiquinone oxidoreductase subunit 3 (subunit A)
MRRETILFVLSLVVLATPLAGVPYLWKDTTLFVVGTCMVLIAVAYRMDARRRERTKADVLHEEYNPGDVPEGDRSAGE